MQWKQAGMRRYKWFSAAIAGIAICLATQGCAMQSEDFEGTWVVTEAIHPGISAMSKTEADDYLGLSLTYLEDQAQLGQRHCASPSYDSSFLKLNDVSQRYKVPAQTLFGTAEKIKSVRITCEGEGDSSPFGKTILFHPGGAAYTVSDGVFFKLEKAKVTAG